MGYCERCNLVPKDKLFLDHIMAVLKHLRENHPDVQPIMWDDMIRSINSDTLKGKVFSLLLVFVIKIIYCLLVSF